MKEIESLIRPELLSLKPYSSARDEFQGVASVYIDANENPFDNGINRYPDPLQRTLKSRLSEIKNIPDNQIFLGNGSDEVLDLIIRLFCIPGKDGIIITPPTYGMYKVLADINDVFVKEVPLTEDFQLDINFLFKSFSREIKILFLCSPNNPAGVALQREDVIKVLDTFPGIVVMDEAYIDFTAAPGFINDLDRFPKLVVTQTLSKAWGMAGIRLGMAFAHPYIISQLNKIKPPYNVNVLTQAKALEKLDDVNKFKVEVQMLISERMRLQSSLSKFSSIKRIVPSDANFLLVEVEDANNTYEALVNEGIIVRNRSTQLHCSNCLRITVGTPEENDKLIALFNQWNNE